MQQLNPNVSRQFSSNNVVPPLPKSISFSKISNPRPSVHQNTQPNYDLASIVHQILEAKPRTAPRTSSQRHSNARAETIPQQSYRPNILINQIQPINLLNTLRNQHQQHQEVRVKPVTQAKMRSKIVETGRSCKNVRRHSTNRSVNRKSQTQDVQECQFETIISRPSQSTKKIIMQAAIRQSQIDQQREEERDLQIGVQTIMNAEVLPSKTKLTINNMKLEAKQQKRKLIKWDLQPQKKKLLSLDQQKDKTKDVLQVIREKRVKKITLEQKIPAFIKASLEVYRNQTDINIGGLIPEINRNDVPVQEPFKQDFESIEQKQPNKDSEDQNLAGAKLTLLCKDKRRNTRIGEYIQTSKRKADDEHFQQSVEKGQKKAKGKSKARRREENIEVCGWQGQIPQESMISKDLW